MSTDTWSAMVVWLSPAGTTRHVADVITDRLQQHGIAVHVCDLACPGAAEKLRTALADASGRVCVFPGSPVYAMHAVPRVMEMIDALPNARPGDAAAPFVTWGAVSSGIALPEMGAALAARGYALPGAAAVVAVHSLLWQAPHPLGHGRPDAEDDRTVAAFVDGVVEKLHAGTFDNIGLDYQPAEARAAMAQMSLAAAGAVLPGRSVNMQRCVQCDVCREACPVRAITLDPAPVFGPECIHCYTCMRVCPHQAVEADLSGLPGFLAEKAQQSHEEPQSRAFL